jgi:hypothetical protein
MPNGQTQVNGLEYVGIEVTTGGNNYPQVAVKQGYFFGWGGSGPRSSTGLPALAVRFQMLEELMTIAAAANSTSANTSILPANSLIHVVMGRVTVAIPTAATFTVGDASQAARFASGVAVALGTTFTGFLHWNPSVASDALGPRQTANAGVRITPNATPANANGRVALQVFSETFIPPTA